MHSYPNRFARRELRRERKGRIEGYNIHSPLESKEGSQANPISKGSLISPLIPSPAVFGKFIFSKSFIS
jgi:hypothetical protein